MKASLQSWLAGALLLAASACSLLPSRGAREYTGTYTSGFESSVFSPSNSKELWWLSGDYSCPGSALELRPADDWVRTPPVVLTVSGRLSRKGRFGHMGVYDRELVVERTLSCVPAMSPN